MVSFSVLIITHGREELLLKCLDSLRPVGASWQLILVANGISLSQKVLDKAHSLTSDVDIVELTQHETPGISRNEGLKVVKNPWIYFIDDDAYAYPKYFDVVLPLLAQDKIDVLGGPDAPAKDMTAFSEALGITLASPFCTGVTYGRHQSKGSKLTPAGEESLTSCNLWVRSHLLENIKFPENYLRTEETALLLDLKNQGARMFYHPGLIVGHFRRKNLKSLLRPTFYAGFYRSLVMREKKLGAGAFWLPSVFVLMHGLVFISPEMFLNCVRIYVSLIIMMSLNIASRKRKTSLFLHVSFLHYFIVFFYGVGFLANRLGFHARR